MTPFVLWLNKNEIDELITLLINSSGETNMQTEVYSTDELMNLTEKLLQQNDSLISILKKIKPFLSNEQIENQITKSIKETKVFFNALENLKSTKRKN